MVQGHKHRQISFSVWPMRSWRDFYFDGAENCSACAHSAHILPLDQGSSISFRQGTNSANNTKPRATDLYVCIYIYMYHSLTHSLTQDCSVHSYLNHLFSMSTFLYFTLAFLRSHRIYTGRHRALQTGLD